jgi:peptidoglycan/LPS O-acetylase OafA/YrhL
MIPDPAGSRPLRVVRLLESRLFVAVGLASYSLFLWHYPIISWLRDHGLTFAGGWGDLFVNLAIIASVAGVLSALTYRFVEVPALRHKRSTRVQSVAVKDREPLGFAAATVASEKDPTIQVTTS